MQGPQRENVADASMHPSVTEGDSDPYEGLTPEDIAEGHGRTRIGVTEILSRLSTGSPYLRDFGVFWISVEEVAQILAKDLTDVADFLAGNEGIESSSKISSGHAAHMRTVRAQLSNSIQSKELHAESISQSTETAGKSDPPPSSSLYVRLEDLHSWLGKHRYPHTRWPFMEWAFYDRVRDDYSLERDVVELVSRYRQTQQILDGSGHKTVSCDDNQALVAALEKVKQLEVELQAARAKSEKLSPLHTKERNSLMSLVAGMYELLRFRPSAVSLIEKETEKIGCHISKNNITAKIDEALEFAKAKSRKETSQLRSK